MATSDPSPPRSEPSEHVRRLLREDETLLWSAKPNRRAFTTATILGTLFLLGILSIFAVPLYGPLLFAVVAFVGDLFGGTALLAAALTLAVVGVLGLLGLFPAAYLVARYRYGNAEYALTDDRVVATSGLVGRDSSAVSLEDVRDVDTNVGVLDKVFGTGTIEVAVAGGTDAGLAFAYLDDPYDVLETIEDARERTEAD